MAATTPSIVQTNLARPPGHGGRSAATKQLVPIASNWPKKCSTFLCRRRIGSRDTRAFPHQSTQGEARRSVSSPSDSACSFASLALLLRRIKRVLASLRRHRAKKDPSHQWASTTKLSGSITGCYEVAIESLVACSFVCSTRLVTSIVPSTCRQEICAIVPIGNDPIGLFVAEL